MTFIELYCGVLSGSYSNPLALILAPPTYLVSICDSDGSPSNLEFYHLCGSKHIRLHREGKFQPQVIDAVV